MKFRGLLPSTQFHVRCCLLDTGATGKMGLCSLFVFSPARAGCVNRYADPHKQGHFVPYPSPVNMNKFTVQVAGSTSFNYTVSPCGLKSHQNSTSMLQSLGEVVGSDPHLRGSAFGVVYSLFVHSTLLRNGVSFGHLTSYFIKIPLMFPVFIASLLEGR